MQHKTARLLNYVVGALLILTGLGFLSLVTLLKAGGALSGDWRVSGFMFVSGVMLLIIGSEFLRSQRERVERRQPSNLAPTLLRLRPGMESLAAIGCLLMAGHSLAAFKGVQWPNARLLWALVVGPIIMGLFVLRILVPGAFRSGLFPAHSVLRWSAATRISVNVLLWLGWLGYLAIPVVWPDFQDHILPQWRRQVQGGGSLLISLLYASQVLILHRGHLRNTT